MSHHSTVNVQRGRGSFQGFYCHHDHFRTFIMENTGGSVTGAQHQLYKQWQTGLLSRGGYVVIRDRISDCSSLFSVSSVLSTSNTETLLHQVHQTPKESSLLRVISTQVTSKLSHVLRLVDLLAFLFCARPGTNWTPLSCIGSGSHFVTAALI